MPIEIADNDALLVIDVQNDFCSGGALAVPHGEQVVPIINRLARGFAHVILTQDWHPAGHMSFASNHDGARAFEVMRAAYGEQMLWPDHCVQDTVGAALHPDLAIPHAELILRKGFRASIDSYSAFFENDRYTATGLGGYLRERGIERIFVCGLAYDYCVRYSALDGKQLGFEALVIADACRAIDLNHSAKETGEDFQRSGVREIETDGFFAL